MKKTAGLLDTIGNIGSNIYGAGKYLGTHNLSQISQDATSAGLNGLEQGATGLMGKVAPWLTLPIAYGLLNSGGGNPSSAPQGGNMGPAGYANPGWKAPIIPQYFGQDKMGQEKLAKTNVPSLVVGAVIGNKATKKEDTLDMPVPAHIVAENQKTEKLLEHPAVKQYVDSLINNP